MYIGLRYIIYRGIYILEVHISAALSLRIGTCRMATENFFNLKNFVLFCLCQARRKDAVDEAMRVRSMRCI